LMKDCQPLSFPFPVDVAKP